MVYIIGVSKLQLASFRQFRLWLQKGNISAAYLNGNCTKPMFPLLFMAGCRKFQRSERMSATVLEYLEIVYIHKCARQWKRQRNTKGQKK
jgi:hypothetical protein